MENPTLGIRCRIVIQILTGVHLFDGNSHKIRSDPSRSARRIKSPGWGTKVIPPNQNRSENLNIKKATLFCQRTSELIE